jgi:hypothetical protein
MKPAHHLDFDTEHLQSFNGIRLIHSAWLHVLSEGGLVFTVEPVTEHIVLAVRDEGLNHFPRADKVDLVVVNIVC